jgi:tripartite-type tricarboxylate transporter receptor subunit TctC
MPRKTLAVLAALAVVSAAQAQTYPNRPARIVVPFAAGSFTDLAARALGADLAAQLGSQFIVENRTGAGGTIGVDAVAKSAPDGHTLLLTENSFTISPALYPKLPYDPLKDFIPVTSVAVAPYMLWARTDLPAKNIKELVDAARANPGKLTFGSGGQGSSSHLSAELFFEKAGISVTHVPFKGVAPAMTEVMAGRVDFGGSSAASPAAHIRAGKLRPLALTGRSRSAMLPEVPTFAESGFADYDAPIWFGVIAPAGVPAPIVERLHQALSNALAKPEIRSLFEKQGAVPGVIPSAEFARRLAAETRTWKDLVARRGIKIE